jgi:serine/threonine protein kinase
MDQSLQVLWGDGERVLFRGSRLGADGERKPVLAVLLAADRPLPLALERLANEYELRNELDGAWAARPLEFVREDGRAMLVLEDPGGEPLARLLGQPMEIGVFLRLAIGVAAALAKAHQVGLIHKDQKPGNILVNCADGAARLTGFGIATRLPRERQTLAPPETIAGTLAYMAPEQTGWMNRSIDSRSDLYSLGVVFSHVGFASAASPPRRRNERFDMRPLRVRQIALDIANNRACISLGSHSSTSTAPRIRPPSTNHNRFTRLNYFRDRHLGSTETRRRPSRSRYMRVIAFGPLVRMSRNSATMAPMPGCQRITSDAKPSSRSRPREER